MTDLNTLTQDERRATERSTRNAYARVAAIIASKLGASIVEKRGEYGSELDVLLSLGERRFWLHFGGYGNAGKVRVSGAWPQEKTLDGATRFTSPRDLGAIGYNDTPPEIGCSVNKGADKIAMDIQRRFLPAFYRVHDACVVKVAEFEADGRLALATARKLAPTGAKIEGNRQEATFYGSGFGPVRVSAHGGKVSVRFERNLDGLNIEQARAILRILDNPLNDHPSTVHAKDQATVSTCEHIVGLVSRLDAKTNAAQHTDVGEAWEVLLEIRDHAKGLLAKIRRAP